MKNMYEKTDDFYWIEKYLINDTPEGIFLVIFL